MAIDVRQQAEPQPHPPAQVHATLDVHQTTCCVVGGRPGGVVLGLLLARQGIPTTLLEATLAPGGSSPDRRGDCRASPEITVCSYRAQRC